MLGTFTSLPLPLGLMDDPPVKRIFRIFKVLYIASLLLWFTLGLISCATGLAVQLLYTKHVFLHCMAVVSGVSICLGSIFWVMYWIIGRKDWQACRILNKTLADKFRYAESPEQTVREELRRLANLVLCLQQEGDTDEAEVIDRKFDAIFAAAKRLGVIRHESIREQFFGGGSLCIKAAA